MRLLLFSASFGYGHLQAARAVAQAHRALDPDHEAIIHNMNGPLTRAVAAGYLALLRWAPGLYRTLYHGPVTPAVRRVIEWACQRSCLKAIARYKPDAILCTHPFPGLALAALRQRGELPLPIGAVVTDWGSHPLWLHAGFDHYFVAASATKRGYVDQGIPADRITVTGIPIRPIFQRTEPHRSGTRVLVMGGGLGLGPITEAVRSLAELSQKELTITVVCGQNGPLYQELTDLFADDPRFTILGYHDAVHELMAEADLLMTKPGGLSAAEALAMGLPLVLLSPLPGQEEENAEHLVELGAAKRVADVWIGRLAEELLFRPGSALAKMQLAARAAGQPWAAHLIATRLKALNQGGSPS